MLIVFQFYTVKVKYPYLVFHYSCFVGFSVVPGSEKEDANI
jgi:hypothetical protein